MQKLMHLLLVLALGCFAFSASAQTGPTLPAADIPLVGAEDAWRLQYSPFTQHTRPRSAHKYVWMLGLEHEKLDGSISGALIFSNSFGQPSAYVYPWGGIHKNLWGVSHLYFKWNAGLMYGYVKEHKNDVPLNVNGFSPGVFPAIGWRFNNGAEVQAETLGTAGIMFQVAVPIKFLR